MRTTSEDNDSDDMICLLFVDLERISDNIDDDTRSQEMIAFGYIIQHQ